MNKLHSTALITGGSQGLGLAVAKIFDKRKMQVMLSGRSRLKLENCLSDFDNSTHGFIADDLSQESNLKEFLGKLAATKFIPDIIIHSLGGKIEGDMQPLTAELLQRSIHLNLGIAAQINAHFLPVMLERQQGCIIHISSDASLTGDAAPGYVASKAAINAYVKSTSRFYAKHNIMMCAILPGVFEHDSSSWTKKKITHPEYYEKKRQSMPLGRFADSSEIAKVVADIACSNNMVHSGSLIELASR
jgi:3-oxoacyl-[acyl-carrier protein] reductase